MTLTAPRVGPVHRIELYSTTSKHTLPMSYDAPTVTDNEYFAMSSVIKITSASQGYGYETCVEI
jgi:hypothetical protein